MSSYKERKKKNRFIFKAWGISSIILLPCLVFYVTESFYHNPFTDIASSVQMLNCLMYITLACFLWFLIGNREWAIRILVVIGFAYGLANYYLIGFRGIPVLPWDILFVGTAARVMGEFDFSIVDTAIISAILCFALFVAAGVYKKKARIDIGRKPRWILFGLTVVLLLIQYFLLASDAYREKFEVYENLYAPYTMSQQNGLLVALVVESHYMGIQKPEDYSLEDAQNFFEGLEADVIDENTSYPNVIVIMSECFSDLSFIGDYEASEDEIPFVHEIFDGMEDTVSGTLHVNVLAGNTANTEFEFLTGHTQSFFPDGSVSYQQYINQDIPSLVSHMNEIGYSTVAFHPFYETGWNRNVVYEYMQFDTFIDETDLEDPTRIRAYIDDYTVTDRIIEEFEAAQDPLFMFTVTMQNHSPYYTEYDNFEPNITVEGSDDFSLQNFLSLMQISDEALEELVDYLENSDKETIVVFFGDHQPADSVVEDIWTLNGVDSRYLTEEEFNTRYTVPFVVWANYDIEDQTEVETSANFLSAQIFEWCDIPKSAYQNYLLEILEEYPIITTRGATTSEGLIADLNKINKFEGIDDTLLEYQQLQYYLMFD
ncbi:MAG: sulfatase-like hydrolase/transferase [Lachnospiraceae bacterium]